MTTLPSFYNICVIDVGSPKLGNLGWCLLYLKQGKESSRDTGADLDALLPLLTKATEHQGLILGLEAPLFVPIRQDLMLLTRGRRGDGNRPWSAGAGAQVLTLNLAVMVYLFKAIKEEIPRIRFHLNEETFQAKPREIMLFEAFVSGKDKAASSINRHINDARIMAETCLSYAKKKTLPHSILREEEGTEYFNLAAAALLQCGLIKETASLKLTTPIYKPN